MKALWLIVPILALGACSSDLVTGGPLIRPNEPTGTILVRNQHWRAIDAVLISHCGASTYGLNRMVKRETIPVQGTREFGVSAGCWDVAVIQLGGDDKRQRLDVRPNETTVYTFTTH